MRIRKASREPELEKLLSAEVAKLSLTKPGDREAARGKIGELSAGKNDAVELLDKMVYPKGLSAVGYGEYLTDARVPVGARARAVAKLSHFPDDAYFQPLYSIVSAPVDKPLEGDERFLLRDAGTNLGVMAGFMHLSGLSCGRRDAASITQARDAIAGKIIDPRVDDAVRESLMFGLSFIGEPAVTPLVGFLGNQDYAVVRQALNALRDMPENFDVLLARRGFQYKDLTKRIDPETQFREKQHMISVLNAKVIPALEPGVFETNPGRRRDYGYTYDKIRGAKARKPVDLSDPATVARIRAGVEHLKEVARPDPADAWKAAGAGDACVVPANPFPREVPPDELGGFVEKLVGERKKMPPQVQQYLVNCIGSTIFNNREAVGEARTQILEATVDAVGGIASILKSSGRAQGGRGVMSMLTNLSKLAAESEEPVADQMLAGLAFAAPLVAEHIENCVYPEGGCDAFDQSAGLAFLSHLVSCRERIPEKEGHALWYGVIEAIPHSAGVLGATDPIRIDGARFYGQVAEVAAGLDAKSAKPIYDTFEHVATPLVDASIDSNTEVQDAALSALRSIAHAGLTHKFHGREIIRKRLSED